MTEKARERRGGKRGDSEEREIGNMTEKQGREGTGRGKERRGGKGKRRDSEE